MSNLLSRLRKAVYSSHLNIPATLYLNFRVFSFVDAIKLPVYVYGRVSYEGIHKGCIKLDVVKRHTLKLGGGKHTELFGRSNLYKSYFCFKGLWFVGSNVVIDQGAIISVCHNAKLLLGNNIYINRNCMIHVKKEIIIGDNTRMGWKCQLLDTDFHYTVHNGIIRNRNKNVVIDHNVWLANGVCVQKGTILPAYSVVAANSLVNRDFTECGDSCLYGGIPAKLISTGIRRLLDVEKQLDSLFQDGSEIVYESDLPRLFECDVLS